MKIDKNGVVSLKTGTDTYTVVATDCGMPEYPNHAVLRINNDIINQRDCRFLAANENLIIIEPLGLVA